ncbi:MAG: hypothetical protein ACD_52C00138G0006 [uncultured bacterium]|uniref:Uncharacterized protein n=1 Tax=Candidatus Woesebacteria bacterium RIFCSPHIGHO2_12_FULL_41_24 TaxID=1802510 RepID=A0A1F8ATF0_9BACT|nr:MAG: hypothetical protein ACD_52C00138G0006 [uncultured bacterium]OGM14589.1 MAG: hypothetical protein A2W15_01345 [Candidatus Woesebacteria bacterium RBG_16_41_13]OGM30415.1 MAG: hypothetical protein A2873_00470 [Candidatus Woesebacteria bacterium RIFCSPHIGHO2_01_FULL_42_80]OGM35461.1 MAG: hypothetical protein A3D84_05785 [Candidatus Woesebacteria bacterium RIFCSPHIGHO2_02_FULL_42_20]OGM55036.1 MAG: hypothetical protein A3E44_04770 [Candidatus Woesebacteria bacterium RIFCSPHIGHO2_12_FULL_41
MQIDTASDSSSTQSSPEHPPTTQSFVGKGEVVVEGVGAPTWFFRQAFCKARIVRNPKKTIKVTISQGFKDIMLIISY